MNNQSQKRPDRQNSHSHNGQSTSHSYSYSHRSGPPAVPYNQMIYNQQNIYPPNYYQIPSSGPPVHHSHHHLIPHPHHIPLPPGQVDPYNPMFLFPQSSIFASYLQLVQPAPYPSINNPSNVHIMNHSPSSPIDGRHGNFSIPRGPPKKPKKSGFALWVGNLPPSTTLLELCFLFGTNDIQSIFLIQKTFCAFVNYKSKMALLEGKQAFEKRGKILRGNQLVIKIKTDESNIEDLNEEKTFSPASTESKDRYFVCKSLTVEDLQASAMYGMWATQSHNQSIFNEAFKVRKA